MSHLFPMTLPHVKHLTGMIMAPRDCACPFLSLFRESRHDDRSPVLSPSADPLCRHTHCRKEKSASDRSISGAAPVRGGRRKAGRRVAAARVGREAAPSFSSLLAPKARRTLVEDGEHGVGNASLAQKVGWEPSLHRQGESIGERERERERKGKRAHAHAHSPVMFNL